LLITSPFGFRLSTLTEFSHASSAQSCTIVATRQSNMEALQEAIRIAEQERDAALALTNQANAARTAAEELAAQALVDLTTAQAATATAQAAVLAAASVAAGNVTFALSPALASSTLLDYRTGEGIKIYGKATSPLDVAFDGDSGALRLFLNKVQQRATQFGWTG
jgi:hypothetical protein